MEGDHQKGEVLVERGIGMQLVEILQGYVLAVPQVGGGRMTEGFCYEEKRGHMVGRLQ